MLDCPATDEQWWGKRFSETRGAVGVGDVQGGRAESEHGQAIDEPDDTRAGCGS